MQMIGHDDKSERPGDLLRLEAPEGAHDLTTAAQIGEYLASTRGTGNNVVILPGDRSPSVAQCARARFPVAGSFVHEQTLQHGVWQRKRNMSAKCPHWFFGRSAALRKTRSRFENRSYRMSVSFANRAL
jgi:hypothetical protein